LQADEHPYGRERHVAGGSGGGEIIASGTPEQVAENPASYTGQFLKPLLKA